MAMPPVFPTDIFPGFSVHKKPTFSSIVQTSVSGREVSSARQAYPLWEFELTFELLREQTQNQQLDLNWAPYKEFQQGVGFFIVAKGQANDFLFDDPSDDSRTSQAIGIGDGLRTAFRIVRTWGTGPFQFVEPVGALNIALPFTIYLNAIDDTGNWAIDGDQISITRVTAPNPDDIISMDFSFYYRCRFMDDIEDFEQFFKNIWSLQTLKFRSVKL